MDGRVHPDFAEVAERVARQLRARRATGGASVAVYHHGELVVDIWGGVRDEQGTPWTADTMAMSFSTTKGVVATVVHRLVARGELAYDEPVATYWPEFAAAGKEAITVRDLLTHRAALHAVRPLVDDASDLLDWNLMTTRLAAASPAWEPGVRPGYHALTFGWLVGELIRRTTGTTVEEAVQREIAEPLDVDGLHIGAPPAIRGDVADLLAVEGSADRSFRMIEKLGRRDRMRPFVEAMLVPGLEHLMNTDAIYDAEMPAANGVFDARSLAKMYSALVAPDDTDGAPLWPPTTFDAATEVQTTQRDAVVMFPMRWRLGYHLAATSAGTPPRGFGHFGFGGSGAWGDPDTGLAVAMVLNQVAGTPFGDTRFLRVGGAALRAARRRDGRTDPRGCLRGRRRRST